MRHKTSLTALAPLLKKPLFTTKEARALGISPATLNHYVKTGSLKRVSRGIYQGINSPSCIGRWGDLVEAIYSTGGTICLISALAIYDLTEEIPRQHWIGIRHGTSVKKNAPIKIIRFRNMNLGKTEVKLEGTWVPIFDRERTLIDVFRLLSRETAIKALRAAIAIRGKNRLDLKKLEAYAKRLRFDITPYLLSVTT
jgi:predicted transcriptional regulator of viral defense system